MINYVIFLLSAMLAGTLSGLLGIGGGSLLVPMFLFCLDKYIPNQYIGHVAIATSTALIFFTSSLSGFTHFKNKLINTKILIYLSLGSIIGVCISANFLFLKISNKYLNIIFITFLIYTAFNTIFQQKKHIKIIQKINYYLIFMMGILIAAISSIIGVGGGFLTVPFLLSLGLSIHSAIATSAALGITISLTATFFYSMQNISTKNTLGLIYYPALLIMIPVATIMAVYGSNLANKFNAKKLKSIYGYFLIILIALLLFKLYQQHNYYE